jgi:hypothetical protein
MSDVRPDEMASLTPPTSDALDAACDRFEAAWRAALAGGPRPAVEDHLAGVLYDYGQPAATYEGTGIAISNLITMSPNLIDIEVGFAAARAARFEHGECP